MKSSKGPSLARLPRRFLMVLAGVVLSIPLAWAGPACTVKSFNGMSKGVVLQKGKSDKFYSLINEGMNKKAVRCCVACTPELGTRVLVTDMGFASHTVEVLEGSFEGCVGTLNTESVDCG